MSSAVDSCDPPPRVVSLAVQVFPAAGMQGVRLNEISHFQG